MKLQLKEIEGNKLKNKIYNELLKNIITSNISPGDQLQIKEVANNMNVSNTPVREALEALKNDGLLNKLPYKSYTVKKHTFQEAKDVYETSAAIESYTIKLAIERINEDEIDKLIALHDKGYDYLSSNNTKKYKDYDEKLHYQLVQASKNEYLINMYKNIKLELALFSYQVLGTIDRIKQSYKQHSEIIKLLKNNNKKEASLSIEEHILSSWDEYKKYNE